MKVYDISWPISSVTTEYKNRKSILSTEIKSFEKDSMRESTICMHSHTATHVDAPSHFLKDGKTIDQIRLDRLIGQARVIDLMTVMNAISADDLARYEIRVDEIILLRTTNSAAGITDAFNKDFIYLDPSGAQYLADKKVKAVGIDYLGIERGDSEHTTHTILMKADIVVIEGLRLFHTPTDNYFMVCLPLALIGIDAAPARAILIKA